MNDKTRKGMASHDESVDWFTPRWLFEEYDRQFHFTTDPCTDARNHLGCKIFYTKEDDGLVKPWSGNVWINPPYGRAVDKWVAKGAEYARSGQGNVVMLIAARPETKRFHKYIWDKARRKPRDNVDVDFLEGRIKFLSAAAANNNNNNDGYEEGNSPFFPSMVVVFHTHLQGEET